jgi:hypothetical protein
MFIDPNSLSMNYLLLTIGLIGLVLAYGFFQDVKRTLNIFKKFDDLQITYDDCPSFSDQVALYIVRNF